METSWEVSTSKGEIFINSAVSREEEEGEGESHRSMREEDDVNFLGVILVLLLYGWGFFLGGMFEKEDKTEKNNYQKGKNK